MAAPATSNAQVSVGQICQDLGLTDAGVIDLGVVRVSYQTCFPADVPQCDENEQMISLPGLLNVRLAICLPPFTPAAAS